MIDQSKTEGAAAAVKIIILLLHSSLANVRLSCALHHHHHLISKVCKKMLGQNHFAEPIPLMS
jgi:hypothetical protein